MRSHRQNKPDSILFLFVIVTLGMLVTSYAQAESYLFGQQGKWLTSVAESDLSVSEFQTKTLPSHNRAWLLLPGSTGTKTTFNGGMAHFLFENNPDNDTTSILPVNTRLILSLGLEENADLTSGYQADALEWYDRYQPTMYFTLGHRW